MTATTTTPTVQEQASAVLAHVVGLAHVAGYASHRTIAIGLRSGLLEALAAYAAGICDRRRPVPVGRAHGHPAAGCNLPCLYRGRLHRPGATRDVRPLRGQPRLRRAALVGPDQPRLDRRGRRHRHPLLHPPCPRRASAGPGAAERLAAGATVVDSACGAGVGLVRLAAHNPACRIVGVDGDGRSVEQARKRIAEAGLADRVSLVRSPLEELHQETPAALVVNNISMHECRDIDLVTERILACLEPGGWFVISDFPFPDTEQGLRSVPGRIMGAIQFSRPRSTTSS